VLEDEANTRLGTLLEKAGLVTSGDIAEAVAVSKRLQTPIGRVLIMTGSVTERTLSAALEAQAMLRDRTINLEAAIEALVRVAQEKIPLKDALVKTDKIPQPGTSTNKLGEILIEFGLINKNSLDAALQTSAETGMPLGSSLVCLGAISPSLLPLLLRTQEQIRDGLITRQQAVNEFREAYAMWTKAKESVIQGDETGLQGGVVKPVAQRVPEPAPIVASSYQDYYRKLAAQSFPNRQSGDSQSKPAGYQQTPAEFANYQPKQRVNASARLPALDPTSLPSPSPIPGEPQPNYPTGRNAQPTSPPPPMVQPQTIAPQQAGQSPQGLAWPAPPAYDNDPRATQQQAPSVQGPTVPSQAPQIELSWPSNPPANAGEQRSVPTARHTDVAMPSFERMAAKQQHTGSLYSPQSTSFDMPAAPGPDAAPASSGGTISPTPPSGIQTHVLPKAAEPSPPQTAVQTHVLPKATEAPSPQAAVETHVLPKAAEPPTPQTAVQTHVLPKVAEPAPMASLEPAPIPPDVLAAISSPANAQSMSTPVAPIPESPPPQTEPAAPEPVVDKSPSLKKNGSGEKHLPHPQPSDQHMIRSLPLPPAVLAAISSATKSASLDAPITPSPTEDAVQDEAPVAAASTTSFDSTTIDPSTSSIPPVETPQQSVDKSVSSAAVEQESQPVISAEQATPSSTQQQEPAQAAALAPEARSVIPWDQPASQPAEHEPQAVIQSEPAAPPAVEEEIQPLIPTEAEAPVVIPWDQAASFPTVEQEPQVADSPEQPASPPALEQVPQAFISQETPAASPAIEQEPTPSTSPDDHPTLWSYANRALKESSDFEQPSLPLESEVSTRSQSTPESVKVDETPTAESAPSQLSQPDEAPTKAQAESTIEPTLESPEPTLPPQDEVSKPTLAESKDLLEASQQAPEVIIPTEPAISLPELAKSGPDDLIDGSITEQFLDSLEVTLSREEVSSLYQSKLPPLHEEVVDNLTDRSDTEQSFDSSEATLSREEVSLLYQFKLPELKDEPDLASELVDANGDAQAVVDRVVTPVSDEAGAPVEPEAVTNPDAEESNGKDSTESEYDEFTTDAKKRKKSEKLKASAKSKNKRTLSNVEATSIISLVEVLKLGGCFTQKELLAAFNNSLEHPTKSIELLFAIGLVDEKLLSGAKLCQSMMQEGNLKPQQAAYVISSVRSGRMTIESALEEVSTKPS
jgi:hypothetical protein